MLERQLGHSVGPRHSSYRLAGVLSVQVSDLLGAVIAGELRFAAGFGGVIRYRGLKLRL